MRKVLFSLSVFLLSTFPLQAQDKVIKLGSRLELFVDDFLIDQLNDAKLTLHKPEPQEVVLTTDKPWEGNTCAYYTVFQDGDNYRMYYRGSHYDTKTKKSAHREVVCYAESNDGIHWIKPKLNLFEFNGSKENNIVWDGIGGHNFTPFKDANPKAKKEEKYKALARGSRGAKKGIYAFSSPDGIHWKMMSKEPVITQGAFDSQNLAFYDTHAKVYREYHRTFRDRRRDIQTGTTDNFLSWPTPTFLTYPGAAKEHLYTNAIQPYPRAPHLLIGFPTRYQPKNQQVEPIFMSSRDGLVFHRWNEAVIPITAPKDRDGNRCNYMAWGLVKLPKRDYEYSVYATEAYYTGPDSRLRRFTYRTDGFVSVQAKDKLGTLTTKPLTFEGKSLVVNAKTAKNGQLLVQLETASGERIPGFTFGDCVPVKGDSIEHRVQWRQNRNVNPLSGKAIRVKFQMKHADLYSMQFRR